MELEACQDNADPETEADLSILVSKMLEDFNSIWRAACYCMLITTHRARNHQVGISTYHFWAMLLDPRTKTYIRVLSHEIKRERLWKDVESACVEIARIYCQNTGRESQQQEPVQSEIQRKREKIGTASLQLDNALKLETDGSYNCPLKWWSLNHSNSPSVWNLAERILAIPATSAPAERVFSSAENIVNKKRVGIKPQNYDLIVFLRGNKELINWD